MLPSVRPLCILGLLITFYPYCDGAIGVKTANNVRFVQIIQDHTMMINLILIKIGVFHVLNI